MAERALWVDDVKPPHPGCELARTYEEGLTALLAGGFDVLYLDFDLGSPGANGTNLLDELIERGGTLPTTVRGISSSDFANRIIQQKVSELRATAGGPDGR